MWCFVSLFLVVSTSAINCLERLVSEMTLNMYIGLCVEWDVKPYTLTFLDMCMLHLHLWQYVNELRMWRSQPKSTSVGYRFHMQNMSDADADLSPNKNSLVPAIITTVIQLSYFFFCIFNNEIVPHNTTPFYVHFNSINSQSQASEIPK